MACRNCTFTNCPGCTIRIPVCSRCGHKISLNNAAHEDWWCDTVKHRAGSMAACCDGACLVSEADKQALRAELPGWYKTLNQGIEEGG